MVVELESSGRLEEQTAAGSASTWTILDEGVSSFAIGNDGDAYYLQGGNLYNATSGAVIHVASVLQGQPQPGVTALAQGSGGQFYVVVQWLPNPVTNTRSESLYLYNPATGVSNDLGQIQGFAVRSDGSGYVWSSSGDLFLNTPNQNIDLGMAQGFALRSDGNAYVWRPDGDLLLNTPSQWIDLGMTQGFAMGANGNAYILQNGILFLNTLSRNIWVDGNVSSFTPAGPGSLYVLGTDGNLWLESPNWQTTGRTWVDGNVQQWAPDGHGSFYVLGTNGNLWHESIGWWQQNQRNLILSNVQQFALTKDGAALYIAQLVVQQDWNLFIPDGTTKTVTIWEYSTNGQPISQPVQVGVAGLGDVGTSWAQVVSGVGYQSYWMFWDGTGISVITTNDTGYLTLYRQGQVIPLGYLQNLKGTQVITTASSASGGPGLTVNIDLNGNTTTVSIDGTSLQTIDSMLTSAFSPASSDYSDSSDY